MEGKPVLELVGRRRRRRVTVMMTAGGESKEVEVTGL